MFVLLSWHHEGTALGHVVRLQTLASSYGGI